MAWSGQASSRSIPSAAPRGGVIWVTARHGCTHTHTHTHKTHTHTLTNTNANDKCTHTRTDAHTSHRHARTHAQAHTHTYTLTHLQTHTLEVPYQAGCGGVASACGAGVGGSHTQSLRWGSPGGFCLPETHQCQTPSNIHLPSTIITPTSLLHNTYITPTSHLHHATSTSTLPADTRFLGPFKTHCAVKLQLRFCGDLSFTCLIYLRA